MTGVQTCALPISHEHIEHIGGTEIFGTTPTVIGHPSLRTVLKSRHFLFEEYTEATLPELMVDDTLTLRFNGEDIRLIAVPGGHSGSDIIVWFTGSAVACVDGLCNWPHYPSIDNTTGDVLQFPDIVKRIIDLLPQNTRVIPGHGQDCTMQEFRQFHDMLLRTQKIVSGELAAGRTLEQMQQDSILRDFASFEGSYTSADAWIEYLVKGNQGRPNDTRKSSYEPMYYTLKEKGLDSALAHYETLAREHAGEYNLDETSPAIIGYLLFHQSRFPDATGFFQLSLKLYPSGGYAGLSRVYLGKAFEQTGDIPRALEYYREALLSDPADTATARKIEELETRK